MKYILSFEALNLSTLPLALLFFQIMPLVLVVLGYSTKAVFAFFFYVSVSAGRKNTCSCLRADHIELPFTDRSKYGLNLIFELYCCRSIRHNK